MYSKYKYSIASHDHVVFEFSFVITKYADLLTFILLYSLEVKNVNCLTLYFSSNSFVKYFSYFLVYLLEIHRTVV